MAAVFVEFTSTSEVRISAVYIGRVPLAEHDNVPPCIANRAAGNVIIGETNRLKKKKKIKKKKNLLPWMFTD